MYQSTPIEQSWYHSVLRIMLLVVAVAMVIEAGLVGDVFRDSAHIASQQVASVVGMSAGVAPNELNVITAQLTEKEQQLALREAALSEREIAVSIGGGGAVSDGRATFLLATVLFILLLLIIFNYILDYLRYKEQEFLVAKV